jgi:hypothetical protein
MEELVFLLKSVSFLKTNDFAFNLMTDEYLNFNFLTHKGNITVYGAVLAFDPERFFISYECRDIEDGKRSIEHVWGYAREDKVCHYIRENIQSKIDKYFAAPDIYAVDQGTCDRKGSKKVLRCRENKKY